MDDVELKHIKLQFPASLRLATNEIAAIDQRVRTDRGDLVVVVQGDRAKPAILTYHDLGVNCSSFMPFFNYVDMRALALNFCVYHVNAPGQEDGAPTLPDDFAYPSLDEMANQLNYVLAHFGLKSIIGFGVGAGAHVLAKFAITNPEKVNALALVNCSSYQAGWVEWAYQKMNARSLRARGMSQPVLDYLMWYHFGSSAEERNPDLATLYRNQFARNVNPANLAHFIEAFNRRGDLCISREGATIRPPVLNVTGAMSPHVDETVAFNARLNPNNSTWMKFQDCGLVIEEQPAKISEAFRLFLQGEGYGAPLTPCERNKCDAFASDYTRQGLPTTVPAMDWSTGDTTFTPCQRSTRDATSASFQRSTRDATSASFQRSTRDATSASFQRSTRDATSASFQRSTGDEEARRQIPAKAHPKSTTTRSCAQAVAPCQWRARDAGPSLGRRTIINITENPIEAVPCT